MAETAAAENSVILVLGASAGGLSAMRSFLQTLQSAQNLILVVAQHLSPVTKSFLTSILGNLTSFDTVDAEDNTILTGGVMFVIPPGYDAEFQNDRLRLFKPPPRIFPQPSIDVLLESLATQRGGQTRAAIIFSGMGQDGAYGARCLRRSGGIVFAQEPSSAQHKDMPRATINSGCAEVTGTPAQLAEIVGRLCAPWNFGHVRDRFPEALRNRILDRVQSVREIDLNHYDVRLVNQSLHHRMTLSGASTPSEYLKIVSSSHNEISQLLTAVFQPFGEFTLDALWLSGVVRQYRDWDHRETFRVWCVGCADGQEAYSIAVALERIRLSGEARADYQIVATDILSDCISVARHGCYSRTEVTALDGIEDGKAFVERRGLSYQFSMALRTHVLFATHDVINDFPLSNFAHVVCRGLLPRLAQREIAEVHRRLLDALTEGGEITDDAF